MGAAGFRVVGMSWVARGSGRGGGVWMRPCWWLGEWHVELAAVVALRRLSEVALGAFGGVAGAWSWVRGRA